MLCQVFQFSKVYVGCVASWWSIHRSRNDEYLINEEKYFKIRELMQILRFAFYLRVYDYQVKESLTGEVTNSGKQSMEGIYCCVERFR